VDRYTKMSFFTAVNTMTNAAKLAEIFYREIECKWGPPKGIVTDRGTTFTSKFWKILCQLSGIKTRYTTAYHPQGDGQTERMNQTLKHYLRAFTVENVWNWPNLLHTAFFACNSA
jgi:transposase InsO family protein